MTIQTFSAKTVGCPAGVQKTMALETATRRVKTTPAVIVRPFEWVAFKAKSFTADMQRLKRQSTFVADLCAMH